VRKFLIVALGTAALWACEPVPQRFELKPGMRFALPDRMEARYRSGTPDFGEWHNCQLAEGSAITVVDVEDMRMLLDYQRAEGDVSDSLKYGMNPCPSPERVIIYRSAMNDLRDMLSQRFDDDEFLRRERLAPAPSTLK